MATRNTGLGRGLEALFGDVDIRMDQSSGEEGKNKKEKKSEDDENTIQYIDINQIKPNENQPRKSFDPEKLEELSNSIISHGVIQPVVLRKPEKGKGYELVAGERRWRAARMAGLKTVPALVRELTEEQNMLLSIIENMQREDLNAMEEAEAVHQMMKTFRFTQEEVSKSLGKSRPYIANLVRLLKLPEEIQQMLRENQLTQGHARALLALPVKKQLEVAHKVFKEGWSVRQVEELAAKGKPEKKSSKAGKRDPDLERVEGELKEILGTRVKIKEKGKKGKLEIEYFSRDELERLIELFKSLS
jgi:ParB family chromosome partitioning protein